MEEKTIGERCKEFRREKFLSQEAFAKLCGVHSNTIVNIENGGHPSFLSRARIEKVIGEKMIGGVENDVGTRDAP